LKIVVVDDDAVDRETLRQGLQGNSNSERFTEEKSFAQGLAEVNKISKACESLIITH
jgi:CheY-like chemotaxis protein